MLRLVVRKDEYLNKYKIYSKGLFAYHDFNGKTYKTTSEALNDLNCEMNGCGYVVHVEG